MALSDLFNKKKHDSTVWRNWRGKIVCPGNSCPIECSIKCPIFCYKEGQKLFSTDKDQAFILFNTAVLLAPDYSDAWVGLGSVLETRREYEKAKNCFSKAYDLNRKDDAALLGLIQSNDKLGQYDIALYYCDIYSRHNSYVGPIIRKTILTNKAQSLEATNPFKDKTMEGLLKIATSKGYITPKDNYRLIPELVSEAESVTKKIWLSTIQKDKCNDPAIWLEWAIYAGIGAVQLWKNDWSQVKTKGLAESLMAPRGSFAMDEYVTDLIGVGYNTPDGDKMAKDLHGLALFYISFGSLDVTGDNAAAPSLTHALKQLFLLGMAMQMDRLGIQ